MNVEQMIALVFSLAISWAVIFTAVRAALRSAAAAERERLTRS